MDLKGSDSPAVQITHALDRRGGFGSTAIVVQEFPHQAKVVHEFRCRRTIDPLDSTLADYVGPRKATGMIRPAHDGCIVVEHRAGQSGLTGDFRRHRTCQLPMLLTQLARECFILALGLQEVVLKFGYRQAAASAGIDLHCQFVHRRRYGLQLFPLRGRKLIGACRLRPPQEFAEGKALFLLHQIQGIQALAEFQRKARQDAIDLDAGRRHRSGDR